jgi:hypothetical protein
MDLLNADRLYLTNIRFINVSGLVGLKDLRFLGVWDSAGIGLAEIALLVLPNYIAP